MKLQSWALIAEVISGVAVVITLVLLLLGIRENTQATYVSNYQLLLSDINNLSLTVAQDHELSELRYRYESGGSEVLSEAETLRIVTLYRSLYRIYETAYFANKHDTLGEDEWNRFVFLICEGRESHTDILWERIESIFAVDFRDFIENDCRAVA
jgi:hypothetical protein